MRNAHVAGVLFVILAATICSAAFIALGSSFVPTASAQSGQGNCKTQYDACIKAANSAAAKAQTSAQVQQAAKDKASCMPKWRTCMNKCKQLTKGADGASSCSTDSECKGKRCKDTYNDLTKERKCCVNLYDLGKESQNSCPNEVTSSVGLRCYEDAAAPHDPTKGGTPGGTPSTPGGQPEQPSGGMPQIPQPSPGEGSPPKEQPKEEPTPEPKKEPTLFEKFAQYLGGDTPKTDDAKSPLDYFFKKDEVELGSTPADTLGKDFPDASDKWWNDAVGQSTFGAPENSVVTTDQSNWEQFKEHIANGDIVAAGGDVIDGAKNVLGLGDEVAAEIPGDTKTLTDETPDVPKEGQQYAEAKPGAAPEKPTSDLSKEEQKAITEKSLKDTEAKIAATNKDLQNPNLDEASKEALRENLKDLQSQQADLKKEINDLANPPEAIRNKAIMGEGALSEHQLPYDAEPGGRKVYVETDGPNGKHIVEVDSKTAGTDANGKPTTLGDIAQANGAGNSPTNPLPMDAVRSAVGGDEGLKAMTTPTIEKTGEALTYNRPVGPNDQATLDVKVEKSPVSNLYEVNQDPLKVASEGYQEGEGKVVNEGKFLFGEGAKPPPAGEPPTAASPPPPAESEKSDASVARSPNTPEEYAKAAEEAIKRSMVNLGNGFANVVDAAREGISNAAVEVQKWAHEAKQAAADAYNYVAGTIEDIRPAGNPTDVQAPSPGPVAQQPSPSPGDNPGGGTVVPDTQGTIPIKAPTGPGDQNPPVKSGDGSTDGGKTEPTITPTDKPGKDIDAPVPDPQGKTKQPTTPSPEGKEQTVPQPAPPSSPPNRGWFKRIADALRGFPIPGPSPSPTNISPSVFQPQPQGQDQKQAPQPTPSEKKGQPEPDPKGTAKSNFAPKTKNNLQEFLADALKKFADGIAKRTGQDPGETPGGQGPSKTAKDNDPNKPLGNSLENPKQVKDGIPAKSNTGEAGTGKGQEGKQQQQKGAKDQEGQKKGDDGKQGVPSGTPSNTPAPPDLPRPNMVAKLQVPTPVASNDPKGKTIEAQSKENVQTQPGDSGQGQGQPKGGGKSLLEKPSSEKVENATPSPSPTRGFLAKLPNPLVSIPGKIVGVSAPDGDAVPSPAGDVMRTSDGRLKTPSISGRSLEGQPVKAVGDAKKLLPTLISTRAEDVRDFVRGSGVRTRFGIKDCAAAPTGWVCQNLGDIAQRQGCSPGDHSCWQSDVADAEAYWAKLLMQPNYTRCQPLTVQCIISGPDGRGNWVADDSAWRRAQGLGGTGSNADHVGRVIRFMAEKGVNVQGNTPLDLNDANVRRALAYGQSRAELRAGESAYDDSVIDTGYERAVARAGGAPPPPIVPSTPPAAIPVQSTHAQALQKYQDALACKGNECRQQKIDVRNPQGVSPELAEQIKQRHSTAPQKPGYGTEVNKATVIADLAACEAMGGGCGRLSSSARSPGQTRHGPGDAIDVTFTDPQTQGTYAALFMNGAHALGATPGMGFNTECSTGCIVHADTVGASAGPGAANAWAYGPNCGSGSSDCIKNIVDPRVRSIANLAYAGQPVPNNLVPESITPGTTVPGGTPASQVVRGPHVPGSEPGIVPGKEEASRSPEEQKKLDDDAAREKPSPSATKSPPGLTGDVAKDAVNKFSHDLGQRGFVFGKDSKLLTPQEAAELFKKGEKPDIYLPRDKGPNPFASPEQKAQFTKAPNGQHYEKFEGTFDEYRQRLTQELTAAIENAMRDQQLNSKPETEKLRDGGKLVTKGEGQIRNVFREKDGKLSDKPVGQVREISKEFAQLRKAVELQGDKVKVKEKNGQFKTEDGRRVELRPDTGKDAPPPCTDFTKCHTGGKIENGRFVGADGSNIVNIPGVGRVRFEHNPFSPNAGTQRGNMSALVIHEFRNPGGARNVDSTVRCHQNGCRGGGVYTQAYVSQPYIAEDGMKEIRVVQLGSAYERSGHAGSTPLGSQPGPGIENACHGRGDCSDPLQIAANAIMYDAYRQQYPNMAVTHHQGDEGLPIARALYARVQGGLQGSLSDEPVALFAVSENGDAEKLGTSMKPSELPAAGGTEFESVGDNGNPNGDVRIELDPIKIGTADVQPTIEGDKLGFVPTYTPPPPPPAPPPPPSFRQRMAEAARRQLDNLSNAMKKMMQPPSGGGGGQPQPQPQPPVPPPPPIPPTSTTGEPKITCTPTAAIADQKVRIKWSCPPTQLAVGVGFETKGLANSEVEVRVSNDKTLSEAKYSLRCGTLPERSCTVKIVRPAILMIAQPGEVGSGKTTNLAWAATQVRVCKIYDPACKVVGSGNSGGRIKTKALTRSSTFMLGCETITGAMTTSSVVVKVKGDTKEPLPACPAESIQHDVVFTTSSLNTKSTPTAYPVPSSSGSTELCSPNLDFDSFIRCVMGKK
ncbi:MAG: Uncharacterized protein G01um10148_399 [Parcubacteria group bacterium Gr01-1014_8]|nr:MAG: Uncharacterized protein G01um10148_399 [Parcubacteria group bacterium Gr01-1014_8]